MPVRPPSIYAPDLFKGRVALITGGGSGIGLAIAQELADLGCKIAICGRDEAKLAAAAEPGWLTQACDIREPAQVSALVDRVLAEFGKIDFLVNNAGGQFPATVEKTSFNGWKAVIENNLNGTFLVTKLVGERAMLPAGAGRVVSIVANMWRGFPGMAHTGAARAGVVNLTQSLSIEWASRGVLVNAVAPGIVRSSGTDRYPQELMDRAIAATPLKRMGTVEDVSRAVLYLFSPAGDWITGETLCVDGGARNWGDTWPIP
ncbi:MAG: short-chain dehydrogenase [Cyanobacteria bacterium RYN_339]|nr:short-chain dehydrogenase [Cyanobacteria bacterium RYN_339]